MSTIGSMESLYLRRKTIVFSLQNICNCSSQNSKLILDSNAQWAKIIFFLTFQIGPNKRSGNKNSKNGCRNLSPMEKILWECFILELFILRVLVLEKNSSLEYLVYHFFPPWYNWSWFHLLK